MVLHLPFERRLEDGREDALDDILDFLCVLGLVGFHDLLGDIVCGSGNHFAFCHVGINPPMGCPERARTVSTNLAFTQTIIHSLERRAESYSLGFGISAPKSSAASARSAPSNSVMGNSMMPAALPPAILSANASGLSPARMRLPPRCVPSFAIVSPRFFNTPFEPFFFCA